MTPHRLEPLLNPASIAVIGATTDPKRIGGMPLAHLTRFGFRGEIYPVNPKYAEAFGLRCWPDIESVPGPVDLAVLALGAADVLPMLRRCHARGVRAVLVYAAGFAEAGGQGAELQARLEDFVRGTDMVVAGPNAMGFANLNTQAHTSFASVFRTAPMQEGPGRVSLLTQSGNVCAAVYAIARSMGVAMSHFINTGNEACVDFSQYLQYLAQDDQTDTVLGYIEELRDGPGFIRAAAEFARRDKVLVLYKAGETPKGSEAVRSHTSALAGDQDIYRAAFAQLGVIQATDFTQMAQLAMLARHRDRSAGRRVAIVTISGALGAILADKFILQGLEVPTLPDALQQTLRAGIPDYGMVSNPVDVTGNVVNDPDFVRRALQALALSDAVDCVVIYAPGYLLDRMCDDLCGVARQHARLFVAIDTGAATRRQALEDGGVPVFTDIGNATAALGPFLRWQAQRRNGGHARWLREAAPHGIAATEPAPADAAGEPFPLHADEAVSRRYLARHGIGNVREELARDADEAQRFAVELGFPVAMKVLSADIAHKTEAGGVQLHVDSAQAAREVFAKLLLAARTHSPGARIEGVLVQKMERGVAELILGARRDPVFGLTLTVGLGGVLTEIYRDVSHRVLPVCEDMALDMLRELRAYPLLTGFRGRPRADIDAACRAIAAFSRAALAAPDQLAEMEINPLLVKEDGQGVCMLDALILGAGGTAAGVH